ncbi:hypothetical protein [Halorussus lipolyticus]|uniref:hypothetical protein n=1 Tax=Halorussus lipolyticus TaxID=3034024 RepID=UPI0023E7861C|nr:hypothetical protein [Halorussus sp. DT80]
MARDLDTTCLYKITEDDMKESFFRVFPMSTNSTARGYMRRVEQHLEEMDHWVRDPRSDDRDDFEHVWRRTNLRDVAPNLADQFESNPEYEKQSEGFWLHASEIDGLHPHPEFTTSEHDGEWVTSEDLANHEVNQLMNAEPVDE